MVSENTNQCSNDTKYLLKICSRSVGLSGRSLRKMSFIAHALFLNKTEISLAEFLSAMEKAIEREHSERHYFKNFGIQENGTT